MTPRLGMIMDGTRYRVRPKCASGEHYSSDGAIFRSLSVLAGLEVCPARAAREAAIVQTMDTIGLDYSARSMTGGWMSGAQPLPR